MRNIKLTIAYEGSDFCGWQIQPGQPTIQGVLTDALRGLTREETVVHGAGRTDAGVHAWGQVANFVTASEIPTGNFKRALNSLLPPAIRVWGAEEVALDFDARWSACAKTYCFRIYPGAVLPPHLYRYVVHCPFPLAFAAMAEAARFFEGQHDFTSFAASSGSPEVDRERIMCRSIYRSEFLQTAVEMPLGLPGLWSGIQPNDSATDSAEWIYVVRGRSFLRQMVRKIVGTLLEVGRGRMTPQDIPRLLAQRDPACSGPTAPPHGLWLLSVEYPGSAGSLAGESSQDD